MLKEKSTRSVYHFFSDSIANEICHVYFRLFRNLSAAHHKIRIHLYLCCVSFPFHKFYNSRIKKQYMRLNCFSLVLLDISRLLYLVTINLKICPSLYRRNKVTASFFLSYSYQRKYVSILKEFEAIIRTKN